ncbi:MAG: hypothetical protein IPH44_35320 [Myxococcales bacterium]|nr:hypothetical protein [Myxococcales bacterium]MBK7194710.1 hypothetical protein [Myxococcales bacterium]MBP6847287.1 hypothetical protein [Kofleriaceae bacterium]
MGIGHRLVATLGFVVPAALAAWITLGVDAHAAPSRISTSWSGASPYAIPLPPTVATR